MTAPPITIRISPNERATAPERYAACIDAALERGFEVVPDAGAEVDLVLSLEDRTLGIDLKMPQDLIGSLQNGHLGEQRRNCPYPLRIAVLGSLGDVMRALPTVTKAGWRNPREQAQAEGMVLRGIVALQASGVEVDFGMSPLEWRAPKGTHEAIALSHNIAQTMRRAEYILRSKIYLPRARCESAKEAMLRCLPGVGPETARAMLSRNIVPWVAKTNDRGEMWSVSEGELMELPGIGKKKAEKILKALDG
jgi:hypothetical protein